MNILFIHQSFPGQYRHILRALSSQGCHQLVALGIHPLSEEIPSDVKYFRYGLTTPNTPNIHPWMVDFESKFLRGYACAKAAQHLKEQGFIPDIILAHPGWGESLFLKNIWPKSPLLSYQEFFYNNYGFDYNFDPEFKSDDSWQHNAKLKIKNVNPLLMLEQSDWNTSPTLFQRNSFPESYRKNISVIHDGIDTKLASPQADSVPFTLSPSLSLCKTDKVITFVNRTLEPYRGCHTFIRSIPLIQQLCPDANIVIVGSDKGVSYGQASPNGDWKDIFLSEIDGNYNPEKVHFVGSLTYDKYLSLLKISSCHVYLTYPFVLSWSLLEAMSIGLPIVASSTLPVMEVIQDKITGLLVDFFSPDDLANSVEKVINNPRDYKSMGSNARSLVLEKYSLEKCVPQHLSFINLIASGSLLKEN